MWVPKKKLWVLPDLLVSSPHPHFSLETTTKKASLEDCQLLQGALPSRSHAGNLADKTTWKAGKRSGTLRPLCEHLWGSWMNNIYFLGSVLFSFLSSLNIMIWGLEGREASVSLWRQIFQRHKGKEDGHHRFPWKCGSVQVFSQLIVYLQLIHS